VQNWQHCGYCCLTFHSRIIAFNCMKGKSESSREPGLHKQSLQEHQCLDCEMSRNTLCLSNLYSISYGTELTVTKGSYLTMYTAGLIQTVVTGAWMFGLNSMHSTAINIDQSIWCSRSEWNYSTCVTHTAQCCDSAVLLIYIRICLIRLNLVMFFRFWEIFVCTTACRFFFCIVAHLFCFIHLLWIS